MKKKINYQKIAGNLAVKITELEAVNKNLLEDNGSMFNQITKLKTMEGEQIAVLEGKLKKSNELIEAYRKVLAKEIGAQEVMVNIKPSYKHETGRAFDFRVSDDMTDSILFLSRELGKNGSAIIKNVGLSGTPLKEGKK